MGLSGRVTVNKFTMLPSGSRKSMARFPHGWLNRPGVSGELRGDGLRERTGFRGSMKGSSWESCGWGANGPDSWDCSSRLNEGQLLGELRGPGRSRRRRCSCCLNEGQLLGELRADHFDTGAVLHASMKGSSWESCGFITADGPASAILVPQ